MNATPELPKPSTLNMLGLISACSLISAAGLYYGMLAIWELLYGFINQTDIITFQKDGFVYFWIGVFFLLLSFASFKVLFKVNELPPIGNTILRFFFYFSFFMIVIGVQGLHYLITYSAENMGYQLCTGKSEYALFTVEETYAKPGKCVKDKN